MTRLARFGSRASARLQASLYWNRKQRLDRYNAQKAIEEAGNPGIFSADFSGDFE